MAQDYNDSISLKAPKVLDDKSAVFDPALNAVRPYADTTEFNTLLPFAYRAQTQIAWIIKDGQPVLHALLGGRNIANLVAIADPAGLEKYKTSVTDSIKNLTETINALSTPPPATPAGFEWVSQPALYPYKDQNGAWHIGADTEASFKVDGVSKTVANNADLFGIVPLPTGINRRIDFTVLRLSGTEYIYARIAGDPGENPVPPTIVPTDIYVSWTLWSPAGGATTNLSALEQEVALLKTAVAKFPETAGRPYYKATPTSEPRQFLLLGDGPAPSQAGIDAMTATVPYLFVATKDALGVVTYTMNELSLNHMKPVTPVVVVKDAASLPLPCNNRYMSTFRFEVTADTNTHSFTISPTGVLEGTFCRLFIRQSFAARVTITLPTNSSAKNMILTAGVRTLIIEGEANEDHDIEFEFVGGTYRFRTDFYNER